MVFRQSRFISVLFSPELVKVAQVKRSGQIEKLVKRAIDKTGVDTALKSALAGLTLKGSGVLCIIPGDVATTKIIEVPSVDKDEIESILSLQAARHTPFNKDEILTGHIYLGCPKPKHSRVLLVVVKRETVKEKLAIMKRAGLDVTAVQFVPEGVSLFYVSALKRKKTDSPVAIIDVGMQGTDFIVEAKSSLLMARNIPVGIEHFAMDTEAPGQFVNEIKASLEAYDQEGNGEKVSRFIFTTNHMALAGLDTALVSACGLKVDMLPYGGYIQADKQIKDILAKDFSDDSALDVIASAFSAVKAQADLVPQEIRDQRSVVRRGRETFKAGVLVIIFLFLVGSALLSRVYFHDAFLKGHLLEKYSDQKVEVRNLESLAGKTRILRQYLLSRHVFLDVVTELYRIVPDEIYLSGIIFDGEGGLSLQGFSEAMSQVFSFVTELENSSLFEGVKTKSTSTKKDRGKDVAVFEIVLKLSPLATEGTDVNKTQDIQAGQTRSEP